MRVSAVLGTVLACAFLVSCGGGATPGDRSAAAPMAATVAASADATSFTGNRADYRVVQTNDGYQVTTIATGVSQAFAASTETLSFADVNVNLKVAADAATLAEADVKLLTELYVAFFNRVPDADGLRYWMGQYRGGTSLVSIADGFYTAAVQFSSLTGYSAQMSNADFVTIIYRNVLGRSSPDAEGLAYWSGALANKTETRGSLIRAILASAHTFKGDATWGFVADLLDNKYSVARDFAIERGLNFKSSEESITRTMQIAAAVTPTGTAAALALIPPVRAIDATPPGRLLIQAFKADGSAANIQDFVDFTHFVINRWSAYANYGVFPMGTLPATAQVGSDISSTNVGGVDYVAMDVPQGRSFYFTALWKAPVIGTVFMRADAKGAGYTATASTPLKIELPYDFAESEFHQAQVQLASVAAPSAESQSLLAKATAAMQQARSAASAADRARASYTALSFVMPLKEKLVLDASAAWLGANGARSDFDMNYEGFGSWTDNTLLAGYNAAKDAGFTSVYTAMDWSLVSPAKGVYNFDTLDYHIDRARALGFKVGLNINRPVGALPAWARAMSFDEVKALYYENARRVVARYGSKVDFYYPAGEFELDMGGYSLEQVAELVRQSLAGARAAAPTRQFGYYVSASAYVSYQMNHPAGALLRSGTDLIAYMAGNGINNDFLGLEMQYGTTFAPIDLQRFVEVLQKTHDIAGIPIYMGETGYSSMGEDYGIPANFYWHDGLTRQAQYEWADGTLRALYALPFVKGYYWVHVDPDNNDYGSDYLSGLIGTGLVSASGAVKKVQSAFKDFMTQLPPKKAASR
jgi:hypothetical protein